MQDRLIIAGCHSSCILSYIASFGQSKTCSECIFSDCLLPDRFALDPYSDEIRTNTGYFLNEVLGEWDHVGTNLLARLFDCSPVQIRKIKRGLK